MTGVLNNVTRALIQLEGPFDEMESMIHSRLVRRLHGWTMYVNHLAFCPFPRQCRPEVVDGDDEGTTEYDAWIVDAAMITIGAEETLYDLPKCLERSSEPRQGWSQDVYIHAVLQLWFGSVQQKAVG